MFLLSYDAAAVSYSFCRCFYTTLARQQVIGRQREFHWAVHLELQAMFFDSEPVLSLPLCTKEIPTWQSLNESAFRRTF